MVRQLLTEGPFSRSWGNNPPLVIVAGLISAGESMQENLLIEVLRLLLPVVGLAVVLLGLGLLLSFP